jgi:hypothetical protein
MKMSHDESVIAGNTWIGNTAASVGGAALLYESASHVSSEHYEDNDADEGGAVAVIAGWGSVELEDCTFAGNEADRGGHLYVDLVGYRVKLRRVDLVDGEADEGGAVYTRPGSDLDLRNVLLAGNDASVAGGAVSVDATTGKIHNSVAIWNDAPTGGGIRVRDGAVFEVTNTVFRENTGGSTVRLESGTAPTIRYNDFYLNALDFYGMPSQVGIDGNLAVTTGFVDEAVGDFTLLSTSALRNAGDPAISDPDGTRSDIGLYGGPYAW